jgi:3,4-dihydroxy-2-butanone 4-phosphate synthase
MEFGKAPMKFKGFEFEVEQTENPAGWKWTVSVDPARVRTGVTKSRSLAVIEACARSTWSEPTELTTRTGAQTKAIRSGDALFR